MPSVKPFRWKVIVLDNLSTDDGIQETVKILSELQLDVEAWGETVSDLWDHHERLQRVDFALCDMNWTNSSHATESFLPKGPFPRGADPNEQKAFVEQWVRAIRYWLSQGKSPTQLAWPRSNINPDDFGLWLAALIETVSPMAQIILYSAAPKVGETGPLAAIGRFRDTPFAVIRKDDGRPIPLERFWELLSGVQARYLLDRPDLRRWFLTKVLMRTLADRPPEQSDMRALTGSDKVTFKAELFFPNLTKAGKFVLDIGKVQAFLTFGSEMTAWQESALYGLEHRLKTILTKTRLSTVAVSDEEWSDLTFRADECGEAGKAICAVLESQVTPPCKKLETALNLCHAALSSREHDLIMLCSERSGSVSYDPQAVVYPPGVEPDENRTNPRLPFQYYYLRRSVDALYENGSEHKTGTRLTSKLNARISADELEISWLDDSKGFDSWDAFKNELVASMDRKGAYRGFPLAVLFGLRYNAKKIEVLIRDERSWRTLWPITGTKIDSSADAKFGIRWTFEYRQQI